MFITSVEHYKKVELECDRELDTWSKVSWGIFLGSVLMSIMLGQWAETGSFGENRALVGGRISGFIALTLLGAYYWRRHVLWGKLDKAFNAYLSTLPESERKAARRNAYTN